MDPTLNLRQTRIQLAALVIGVISLAASAFGAFTNTKQFFFSYLFGWLFWLQLSLGCFLVAMIHQLTGGQQQCIRFAKSAVHDRAEHPDSAAGATQLLD